MTTSEQVRAAYAARLGEPDREAQFEKDGIKISILKYAPSPATGDVTLYLTAGVSDLVQPEYDSTHRLEFFIGLLPGADQIAESLAWLGLMPQFSGKPLAHGHTWRSSGPVIPGYDFRGFFVLQSGEPIVPPIELDDVHVQVLMVAPLFTDELDYFRDHGTDALWDRMEEAEVPIWDPRRVSTFHGAG
jgi:hypothetical protein